MSTATCITVAGGDGIGPEIMAVPLPQSAGVRIETAAYDSVARYALAEGR